MKTSAIQPHRIAITSLTVQFRCLHGSSGGEGAEAEMGCASMLSSTTEILHEIALCRFITDIDIDVCARTARLHDS